jgi:hypothetical protein
MADNLFSKSVNDKGCFGWAEEDGLRAAPDRLLRHNPALENPPFLDLAQS